MPSNLHHHLRRPNTANSHSMKHLVSRFMVNCLIAINIGYAFKPSRCNTVNTTRFDIITISNTLRAALVVGLVLFAVMFTVSRELAVLDSFRGAHHFFSCFYSHTYLASRCNACDILPGYKVSNSVSSSSAARICEMRFII